jgi:hypothetical protein
MRVTIVPGDRVVTIDGLTMLSLDLSSIPSNVHAVQWYGNTGEVEVIGEFGRMASNQTIQNLNAYQTVLDQFFSAKMAMEEADARAAEEHTIIEV